jgi:hypothetical protein
MVKPLPSTVIVLIGTVAVALALVNPGILAAAATEKKPAKKPDASRSTKAPAPKGPGKKYQTAETAAKATTCFGVAPKIDKVTPDEGRAGDKVTITGANFGSADCLRSVSFGPGHLATFTMMNGTTISATVPAGGRKGLAILTVTTSSGEDSKPFLVK